MKHSTTNTYQMKREIIRFSRKVSAALPKPEQKFFADMQYGMLASKSSLLSEIAHALQENSRKINVVDRLTKTYFGRWRIEEYFRAKKKNCIIL